MLAACFSVVGLQAVEPDTFWTYKTVNGKDLKMDVFLPEAYAEGSEFPTIVFFHGGSWRRGSASMHHPDCEYWSQRGMIAVSVDYRLKDRDQVEVPVECMKDANSAIRFLRANAKQLKIDPTKVVAAGASAGGQLAASTAMIEHVDDGIYDRSISCQPNALVLYNPYFKCEPDLSPPNFVKSGLPPVIAFLGDQDPVVSVADLTEFQRSLQAAGNDAELYIGQGGKHGFCIGRNKRNKFFYWSLELVDAFLVKQGILSGDSQVVRPRGVQALTPSDYQQLGGTQSANRAQSSVLVDPIAYQVPVVHPHPSYDVGTVKAVFYDSIDYQGAATRVFAYIGIPQSEGPVPAMVLVHGGGGTAFHKWVKIWNDRGYAAIAMDLEGHIPEDVASGSGRLAHAYSGPARLGRFEDADLPLAEQWMYHAVSDILIAHTLLASLPEVDADRIGITGISWGGILSSLVSGLDSRYKCAIPVYGCGYLYESLGHFKSVQSEAQKFWDPARYFKHGSVPTLWVNGDSDGHFSVNATSHCFETTSDHANLSIHPSMEHGHGPGWDPKRVPEIYAFADQILKGQGEPLARIVKQPVGRSIDLEYLSATPIESATVYYLNEALTYRQPEGQPNAKHERPGPWLELDAQVDASHCRVRAQLPASAKTYYVNLKDSRGCRISSVLVEL